MTTDKKDDALILSAVRTPIGRLQGSLQTVSAPELGATAIRGAIDRVGLPNLNDIDEVYMGNVVSAALARTLPAKPLSWAGYQTALVLRRSIRSAVPA